MLLISIFFFFGYFDPENIFYIIKINNSRGELTDISAKKEALLLKSLLPTRTAVRLLFSKSFFLEYFVGVNLVFLKDKYIIFWVNSPIFRLYKLHSRIEPADGPLPPAVFLV